jgi:hypothetical protein
MIDYFAVVGCGGKYYPFELLAFELLSGLSDN